MFKIAKPNHRLRRRCFAGLLAVATLVTGLSHADDADVVLAQNTAPRGSTEQFVPRREARVANLEIRGDASIFGSEVTLKQVCLWPEADDAAMADLAGLVLLRLPAGTAQAKIDLDQIRTILHDAGVNLATINFSGAGTCVITRSDVQFDEGKALQAWAAGSQDAAPDGANAQPTLVVDAVTTQGQRLHTTVGQTGASAQGSSNPAQVQPAVDDTLRGLLTLDIARRLKLPVDTLQVDFRPEDAPTLGLPTSQFQFKLDVQKGSDLGEQRWLVSVATGAAARKVQIVATARAWQDQVLVARPIAFKQTISADMLEARRVLVDRMGDWPAKLEVAVGSAAARDLRPGMVLTGRMISPVELARPGQLVTIVMRRGGVEIKTIATAMEAGSFGQIIRVKNDANKQQFDVQLTGPQTAVGGDAIQASASVQ
ncbi:MAG: flagellar basal body P-ring formation chaperone FlgA [Tepidisphaeraceae bacterium]